MHLDTFLWTNNFHKQLQRKFKSFSAKLSFNLLCHPWVLVLPSLHLAHCDPVINRLFSLINIYLQVIYLQMIVSSYIWSGEAHLPYYPRNTL